MKTNAEIFKKSKIENQHQRASNGTQNPHRLSDKIDDMVDFMRDAEMEKIELLKIKRSIYDTLRRINDIEIRTLLELRYLNKRSWTSISESLGVDDRTVFRIHNKGLRVVDKIMLQMSATDIERQ